MFAKVHGVPKCCCSGQNRKLAHRSQLVGTRLRSALCNDTNSVRIHSQISFPTLHPVSRCSVVCCFAHSVQSYVTTNRFLCSLVFMGIKSRININHADLAPPGICMLWRLFHTLSHSLPRWNCITLTSRGGVAAVAMLLRVPYTLRLKARSVLPAS